MIARHLAFGQQAEQRALDFLQSKGLRLQERNFRCKTGEIDLIMRDKQSLVFVEVRYRSRCDYGHAFETVGSRKRGRILSTAAHYLQNHPGAAGRPRAEAGAPARTQGRSPPSPPPARGRSRSRGPGPSARPAAGPPSRRRRSRRVRPGRCRGRRSRPGPPARRPRPHSPGPPSP